MKKLALGIMGLLMLITSSFFVGRWTQDAKNGYHYEVLKEKQIEGASIPLRWESASEYVGSPVVEPETTAIEADGRLIYKAKRAFQEESPVASNVRVDDGLIKWEDGKYAYSLKMENMMDGAAKPAAVLSEAEVKAIGQAYLNAHAPQWKDEYSLPSKLIDRGGYWEYTFVLPAGTIGGTPVVLIDKKSHEVTKVFHEQ